MGEGVKIKGMGENGEGVKIKGMGENGEGGGGG